MFGEDDLSDLSELNTYNLNYTAANVKSKLQGAVGDNIIAPLITLILNTYYFKFTFNFNIFINYFYFSNFIWSNI